MLRFINMSHCECGKFLYLRNYIWIIIPSLNPQKYLQKSKLRKWDKNPYALIFFRNTFTRQIL